MELAVGEPEAGEAAEVVTAPALLKVATEAAVLVIRRVDVEVEVVVEDPEADEAASVAEVDVEDEAASTRQKDLQHQLRRHPREAIPKPPFSSPFPAVLHQKSTILVHLLNGHTVVNRRYQGRHHFRSTTIGIM